MRNIAVRRIEFNADVSFRRAISASKVTLEDILEVKYC